MTGPIKIQAVFEDDLQGVMVRIGLWDIYLKGELKCPCGETITHENLTAFKKVNGEVRAYHSIFCATE